MQMYRLGSSRLLTCPQVEKQRKCKNKILFAFIFCRVFSYVSFYFLQGFQLCHVVVSSPGPSNNSDVSFAVLPPLSSHPHVLLRQWYQASKLAREDGGKESGEVSEASKSENTDHHEPGCLCGSRGLCLLLIQLLVWLNTLAISVNPSFSDWASSWSPAPMWPEAKPKGFGWLVFYLVL